jgi:DNA-directed RNA polymerase specialized sigma24 family protein
MLSTFAAVERALVRYTDRLQPRTSSVTALGGRGKGAGSGDPFHPALLGDLEEREELARRFAWLDREEAVVLFRWYVEGAKPSHIAADLGRSLRHVYRRRSSGIESIVALGRSNAFEDADVSEFAN